MSISFNLPFLAYSKSIAFVCRTGAGSTYEQTNKKWTKIDVNGLQGAQQPFGRVGYFPIRAVIL